MIWNAGSLEYAALFGELPLEQDSAKRTSRLMPAGNAASSSWNSSKASRSDTVQADYSGDSAVREEQGMTDKSDRDIERAYSTAEFVAKLRRLADALEQHAKFEIQIAGERIYVPVRARFNIEHEREGEDEDEEIEFQIKWTNS
jgi:amphi-Trp domain-containing protein